MSRDRRNRPLFARVSFYIALAACASACKFFKSTCDEDDRTCLGGGIGRSGEHCIRNGDCATGMRCRDSLCEYAASTATGKSCLVSAECRPDAYCSSELECAPIAMESAAGAACSDSSDCAKGTVCDLNIEEALERGPFAMLSDACRERAPLLESSKTCLLPKACTARGKKDFGTRCDESTQCLAGLYCVQSPLSEEDETTCLGGVELEIEPFTLPMWSGTDCPMDTGIPTAYFEVPFGAGAENDFYRLPFPNDIRRRNGRIELEDHPRPPDSVGPPIAERYLEDVATQDGFSTNPVVYFRFSTALKSTGNLSLSTVKIIDITPDSPDYNTGPTIAWGPPERDSRYICSHWLSLYRPIGTPLRAKTTYAAIVTRGVRTKDDQAFQRSPDFDAMLGRTKPSAAELEHAWNAYAPLRAWLEDAETDIKADDLLNVAVFTTSEPRRALNELSEAVLSAPAPEVKSLTVCKTGVKSPCESADGRGACRPEQPGVRELHGKLSLPIFQAGEAPYERPDDGGDIDTDAQGKPRIVRREDVCFALALPDASAPPNGFPILLYAHGLGGVFNEAFSTSGLASELSRGDHPSAVLAIELPQHGGRRGPSQRPPEDLFFNLQNPAALRGNVLQGAADLLGLIARAAAGIPSDSAPGGTAITFDASRIALYAHGQGATHAALAVAADERVQAVVLAGLAGHFANSTVVRTKPASSAALLPILLVDYDTDAGLPGALVHPMLSLMQQSQDSADPINFASQLFRIGANRGRDVFLVYGEKDHYAPESAQQAYARAAKLQAVEPDSTDDFRTIRPPATHNVSIGTERRTVALRTYDPETDPIDPNAVRDGHYVATGSKTARADVLRFLRLSLSGEPPSIGAP